MKKSSISPITLGAGCPAFCCQIIRLSPLSFRLQESALCSVPGAADKEVQKSVPKQTRFCKSRVFQFG
jgi:hypothetical protein